MSFEQFAELDLRGAFELAILIEEDAHARYERLGELVGRDPAGAGDVFRAMAANEAKHRAELEAYRAAVFRADPPGPDRPRLDGALQALEGDDGELPRTAREALVHALAAERRSFEFYRDALQRVVDPAAAYLFRQLMDEEAEHVAILTGLLGREVGAAGDPRGSGAARDPDPAPRPND
jgi:rubrerythrin